MGQGEVGQADVGEVNLRVTCTRWLLGLAVKESWLGLGGPPLALSAWTGLETLLSPCRGLVSGEEGDKHMVAVRTWRTEVDARTSPEI